MPTGHKDNVMKPLAGAIIFALSYVLLVTAVDMHGAPVAVGALLMLTAEVGTSWLVPPVAGWLFRRIGL